MEYKYVKHGYLTQTVVLVTSAHHINSQVQKISVKN